MRYTPDSVPESGEEVTPQAIAEYLQRALKDVSSSLDSLYNGEFELTYVVPTRPREGMLRYADGTSWDPASVGKGFVVYDGASWKPVLTALDADLVAIAALGFTSTAFLKKTGVNTWALDTTTYQAALGYTPINKGGDTGISGNLAWAAGISRTLSVAAGNASSTLLVDVFGSSSVSFSRLFLSGNGTSASLLIDNASVQLGIRLSQATTLEYYNGGTYEKIWREGNDGAGSTLDADLLDAQQGSYYTNAGNLNAGTLLAARMPALTGDVTTTVGTVGTTIGANKVTLGMMAQIATATILGRSTAGTGNVEVLSALPAVNGASVTSLNASNLASGTVAQARLGSSSTSWSPTISGSNDVAVSSQTITSGSYHEIGDLVFFNLDGTVNTVGSATGNIRVPLPVGAVQGGSAYGWRADSGFYGLTCAIYEDIDKMDVVKSSDGSSVLAAGCRFRINGFYRKA